MSAQMARISATFAELNVANSAVQPPPPVPAMPQMPYWPPQPYPPQPYPPMAPPPPPTPRPCWCAGDPDRGWIGKALAVAGVGVTLIGVVLLLVLAAQAGLLRPELRVAAGGVLGAVLVGIGVRLHARPGGQVGAIALSATGIAALYMDVMAVTTIYHWVAPPIALVIGALVGGGGLSLARRWGSEQLAVLVLVPLVVLAPVITDGVTLLLIGFMIALSAAALLVQIGRDWLWMHAARTAAVTLPLLVALVAAHFGSAVDAWLLGAATGVAALLTLVGALAAASVDGQPRRDGDRDRRRPGAGAGRRDRGGPLARGAAGRRRVGVPAGDRAARRSAARRRGRRGPGVVGGRRPRPRCWRSRWPSAARWPRRCCWRWAPWWRSPVVGMSSPVGPQQDWDSSAPRCSSTTRPTCSSTAGGSRFRQRCRRWSAASCWWPGPAPWRGRGSVASRPPPKPAPAGWVPPW